MIYIVIIKFKVLILNMVVQNSKRRLSHSRSVINIRVKSLVNHMNVACVYYSNYFITYVCLSCESNHRYQKSTKEIA